MDMRAASIKIANGDAAYEDLPELIMQMIYSFDSNGNYQIILTTDEDEETYQQHFRAFMLKRVEIAVTENAHARGMTVEEFLQKNSFDGTLEEYAESTLNNALSGGNDARGVTGSGLWCVSGDTIWMYDEEYADVFSFLPDTQRERFCSYFVYTFDGNGNLVFTDSNGSNANAVLPMTLVKTDSVLE